MNDSIETLRLLTLPQAAQLLHVSIRTLHRMIHKQELPAFKVGGQWRLHESRLTEWIERREQSASVALRPEDESLRLRNDAGNVARR
jgi:excisionase family DNA binding protein